MYISSGYYPPILPFVVLSFTQNSFKAREEEGRPDKYKKKQSTNINKTIGDEGITVDFWIIKIHTSN